MPPPAPADIPFAPPDVFACIDAPWLPTFESLPTWMPSVPTPTDIDVFTPLVFFPQHFSLQQHAQGSLQRQSFLPQQSFDPNRQQPVRAAARAPAVTATLTDFVMILFIVHLRFVFREEPFYLGVATMAKPDPPDAAHYELFRFRCMLEKQQK